MQKSLTRFAQYTWLTNKLPEVFRSLPSSVAIALGVALSARSATFLIDVECYAPEISSTDVVVAEELPVFIYAHYLTIAEPARKREESSTIARSLKKR